MVRNGLVPNENRAALEAKVEAFFRKNPEKKSRKTSFGLLSLNDL